VWAIARPMSGKQVAQSPRDLDARSSKVLVLGFTSRKVPRDEVRVVAWQSIRRDLRD
jgi:hypothetical protein